MMKIAAVKASPADANCRCCCVSGSGWLDATMRASALPVRYLSAAWAATGSTLEGSYLAGPRGWRASDSWWVQCSDLVGNVHVEGGGVHAARVHEYLVRQRRVGRLRPGTAFGQRVGRSVLAAACWLQRLAEPAPQSARRGLTGSTGSAAVLGCTTSAPYREAPPSSAPAVRNSHRPDQIGWDGLHA